MSRVPIVAIIGRPNTGKSTLFNRLIGRRKALVSSVAGTTRDHVMQRVQGRKMDYLLLDTGGIGGGSTDKNFEDDVSAQSLVALEAADVILFTVNSREELTSSDFAIVDMLRTRKRAHVSILLVATKCDNIDEAEAKIPEYWSLGIADEVIAISSVHRIGTDELEEKIIEHLKRLHFEAPVPDNLQPALTPPRVAIIGKPNVGKSSILNALMSDPQRERSARLVSDIPGTTRDSTDVIIRFEDREYIFVDTAGLRHKAKVEEDLETLSAIKALQAVEDSDIVVLVLDATAVISRQDKRIAKLAIEEGKGIVIVLNKSDLLTHAERKEKEEETLAAFPYCRFAPLLHVSALTREGLNKLFPHIDTVDRNRKRRISTKELLSWYEGIVLKAPVKELASSKFITQADAIPPTFVLFTKHPERIDVSQLRFLENNMRTTFAFEGTPIRWITKER